MKNAINSIVSTLLTIVVLFSTFSFTVEKHYCMGQLAEYSLLGNVKGCEMPIASDNHAEKTFTKVPCCNDVLEVIEGTNAELKITKEFSQETLEFAALFAAAYINLFEGLSENVIPFKNHSPPLLTKDIQALYETYLI